MLPTIVGSIFGRRNEHRLLIQPGRRPRGHCYPVRTGDLTPCVAHSCCYPWRCSSQPAPDPGPESLRVVASVPGTREISVLVATDRVPDPSDRGFSSGKSEGLHYRQVTVSVPPNHNVTDIEWPTEKPDASKSFAVVKTRELSEDEFLKLAQSIEPRSPVARAWACSSTGTIILIRRPCFGSCR